MIKHVVFWNLAAGDDRGNSERIAEIRAKADELLPVIPGVLKVEVWENYKPGNRDLALYCEIESVEAEEAYQVHPNHLAFKDFITGKFTDRAAIDVKIR